MDMAKESQLDLCKVSGPNTPASMLANLGNPNAKSRVWPALLSACAVLVAAALASCSKDGAAAQSAQSKPAPAVPVLIGTVTTQPISVQISTFGTVQAFSSVAIKTQVTAIMTQAKFEKGQTLKKGQVIFQLDPRPFQAVLDQAKANLEKDKVMLGIYRLSLKRETDLHDHNSATQDEVDQAQATASAQEATIRADQAAIERAQVDLDNCTIDCPIDGKAGDLLVSEGNLVKLNDITLVNINQVKPIEVFFNVPQSDMGNVRRYMDKLKGKEKLKVQVTLPDEPTRPEEGELFFIDNALDSGSGTIKLGARFTNENERLWPGQYVLANLKLATNNEIVVPSSAVSTGRNGKYVFVVMPDNSVQTRMVTAGIQAGGVTVIEKGLQPGETVVTDGQLRLVDGAKVEVKTDQAPTSAPATMPTTAPEAKP
jgi:multidrug efflux system membrane fusion protein